jgi:hypothetical protein
MVLIQTCSLHFIWEHRLANNFSKRQAVGSKLQAVAEAETVFRLCLLRAACGLLLAAPPGMTKK